MNNQKTSAISFFLSQTFFLGFGYSLLFYETASDAWICVIIGSIIGLFLILLLEYMKNRQETHLLKRPILYKTISILFNMFIYSQILFIFQTFASSFYLTKSPTWFVTLPLPFLIYKICKTGYNTIGKLAEMLLPIALFLLFLTFIGLSNHIDISAFTPILTTSPTNILKGTLLIATYTTIPYFLFLNAPVKEIHFKKKYLLSSTMILLTCIFIISVLGPNLIRIYRYPEYAMLKEIKIFNFIEKIENIISMVWLFNLGLTLSLSSANIKNCLPTKHQNIFFILILSILYFLSLAESNLYPKELILYHSLPYIFLSLELILILTSFLSYQKRN